ncbi:MAG: sigma 54-interacting transcriptional regulator [Myxococcales bacterium]|nr:sigma 54-interacting transcriptional regulator [Myxococcota bacterium]MDW8282372.1 sigma 54-interacting transcriptional regulator [Myxococcales bacterium]
MHAPGTHLSSSSLSSRSVVGATPLLFEPRRRAGFVPVLRSSDGQERRLDRPLRVGSAADNDWVLSDPFVSAHHLMLIPDGDVVRLADRGSRNGTFVNGVRVERAEIGVGACVVLGRTQLRICSAGGTTQLLGSSAAMAAVRATVARLGPLPLPVLVLGESGTGKDLVARALHEHSGRRGAFVALNCGALPRDLVESELFGHERGAFTGAHQRRPGCFVEADGGTLFLDEIGELPLELQPRLLRVLEARAVRPVGGSREVAVDVRVVAATHCDLERAVAEGRFRQDLYYRLAGAEVNLPPLRARPEDIAQLVRHFLDELQLPVEIDEKELARLSQYPWPGNVRQLRHAVQRAAYLSGPRLVAEDILPRPTATGGRRLADLERAAIMEALRQTGNNRRAAAALLGLPKSTLHDRLRRMGLG